MVQQDPRHATAREELGYCHHNRATAYYRLKKYTEAVKEWDKAIEFSPEEMLARRRAGRANSRLRAGQVAEAIAEVNELTKAGNCSASQWYDFARIYSVASGKDPAKQQVYADRAMELLRKAVATGYKDVTHMKQDKDLDPLRSRPDFQKLLESLSPPKEKK